MIFKNSTFVHVCFQRATCHIQAFAVRGGTLGGWKHESLFPRGGGGDAPQYLVNWLIDVGVAVEKDKPAPTVYVWFDSTPSEDVSEFIRFFNAITFVPFVIGPCLVTDMTRDIFGSRAGSNRYVLMQWSEATLACQLMLAWKRNGVDCLQEIVDLWTAIHAP